MQTEINIEDLAEKISEDFNDAIWDLRADVFEKLKAIGTIPADGEGPDNQELVDSVMKRLIEVI